MSIQEYQLSELIQRLDRHRTGRRVLHIHLSQLKHYNRRPHQIRIAASLFNRSLRASEGQLFTLGSGDLFFIYRTTDETDLVKGLDNLRQLFDGDPLMRTDRGPIDLLATFYDLEVRYEEVALLTQEIYQKSKALGSPNQKIVYADPKSTARREKEPINPHRLGELVDTIVSADLSNFMRRQSVFLLAPNIDAKVLFRELFISIMDLRDLLLPQYDIAANRWLFQFLTETLDKRMLALLAHNDDPAISSSFSLNLNVGTILSPEFQAFDSKLKQGARGTIVIELQLIDIYADLPTFVFARNFLHSSGYRICLDGVTTHNLQFFDRGRLGIDLVKLQWSPELGEEIAADPHIWSARIDAVGRARAILCHVDSDEAVKLGQSIGVSMFQGRYLDQSPAMATTLQKTASAR